MAKTLAYAECPIMKFHYRNSSTLGALTNLAFGLALGGGRYGYGGFGNGYGGFGNGFGNGYGYGNGFYGK